jgi:hypothetical protein
LGPDHTSTLTTVHELGSLYVDQGKIVEAEVMLQRELEGYEKALGPDHEWTLLAASDLEDLYRKSGRKKEAKIIHKQYLSMRR